MHFFFVKYSLEKSTERTSCKYILNSISTKRNLITNAKSVQCKFKIILNKFGRIKRTKKKIIKVKKTNNKKN